MVLSRYRAPVVAPPNFVPVDTANCRTFRSGIICGAVQGCEKVEKKTGMADH